MICAFDTETTGLPDWRAPSDADHQPHLVQLAAILLDDDLNEHGHLSMIVKPDGWQISDEIAELTGINHDLACAVGVPEKLVTRLFAEMLYGTRALAVAHNADFDLRIVRIAMLRAGFQKDRLDERKVESFCTMKAATPIVNLPPTEKMVAAGFHKPKPPKLGECVHHFFGEKLEGAHNALVDVRACIRVYQHIQNLGKKPISMPDPIGTEIGAEDVI